MNLSKLFEMQKELDERILDRFPELRNEDLLDKKILALQVELGELAPNWRGFKFWSENQEPRYETVEIYVHGYDGPGTNTRASIEEYRRTPILEDYSFLNVKVGNNPTEIAGHIVIIDENKYFVAPTFKGIKIFKMEKKVISLVKSVKITLEIINRTQTQESFVEYVREEIVPILLKGITNK